MWMNEAPPRVMGEMPTESEWQAIIGNEAAYDGTFWYAVRTTGIFCWPSCKSKPPHRDNASVFRSIGGALKAGYRPCKRCKPTGERLPDEEWVAAVTEYIHHRYMDPLPLQKLADAGHGSPYHLHRTFKRVTGVTPSVYVQQFRIERAKELLSQGGDAVANIGYRVGMPNTPYFITLFKKETGCTPAQYRMKNSRKGDEG